MTSTDPSTNRNQSNDAQVLFDSRSTHYDESWHPRFARHIVELANLHPGERVLDLACGTGLATFAAAQAVGTNGFVVGIDISSGMLAQAHKKLSAFPLRNVELYQHSISDLSSLESLQGKDAFDVIICASALVLLEDPGAAVQGWMRFLKPSGRVLVDVTHPRNLLSGATMERVGRALHRPVPYYRLNFQSPQDLTMVMEQAGLKDVDVKFVSQCVDQESDDLKFYLGELEKPVVSHEYDPSDADEVFEKAIGNAAFEGLANPPEMRQRAKEVFRKEWAGMADADGKVRDIDMVFVGIGTKA